jgi:hypothetical protein
MPDPDGAPDPLGRRGTITSNSPHEPARSSGVAGLVAGAFAFPPVTARGPAPHADRRPRRPTLAGLT